MHTKNTPPQPACKHTSKQHLAGVQCAAPPPMQQYGITNPHDLVRPFVELTPKHFIASPQDPERTRVSVRNATARTACKAKSAGHAHPRDGCRPAAMKHMPPSCAEGRQMSPHTRTARWTTPAGIAHDTCLSPRSCSSPIGAQRAAKLVAAWTRPTCPWAIKHQTSAP